MPIEIVVLAASAWLAVEAWILLRVISLDKKLTFILTQCKRCEELKESDTDQLTRRAAAAVAHHHHQH